VLKNKQIFTCILTTICYLLFLAGCAPGPYVKPTPPYGIPGIYHKVENGQTLWRISKLYNADLEEISRFNHLTDTTKIEAGQLIFIPNRHKELASDIKYSSEDFIWPTKGRVIAVFGQTFDNMINKGLNIQPYNDSDVVAARSGKVVFSTDNFEGFGKTFIIDHGDGFSSVYARNTQVFVKAGDNVQKGQVLARAGSAARIGPSYLHFEIRKGHIPQNPYHYLP
jgi:LysM repeat protein